MGFGGLPRTPRVGAKIQNMVCSMRSAILQNFCRCIMGSVGSCRALMSWSTCFSYTGARGCPCLDFPSTNDRRKAVLKPTRCTSSPAPQHLRPGALRLLRAPLPESGSMAQGQSLVATRCWLPLTCLISTQHEPSRAPLKGP